MRRPTIIRFPDFTIWQKQQAKSCLTDTFDDIIGSKKSERALFAYRNL